MDYDVLVLGGGIIGCAAAYELSKYNLNIAVIEKEYDIADDISFVNTAIVYDGSETSNNVMSGLEYIGNILLEDLCSRFNVPFKRIGALRVVNDENGVLKLKEMYDRTVKRGIDGICLINGDEVKKIEPNINTDIKKGLYSKNVAIVAPYDLAIAYAEVASENGVNFRLEEEVLNIEKINKGFRVVTNRNKFTCKVVINTIADEIYINEKGVVKEKNSEAEEDSFKNMSYIIYDLAAMSILVVLFGTIAQPKPQQHPGTQQSKGRTGGVNRPVCRLAGTPGHKALVHLVGDRIQTGNGQADGRVPASPGGCAGKAQQQAQPGVFQKVCGFAHQKVCEPTIAQQAGEPGQYSAALAAGLVRCAGGQVEDYTHTHHAEHPKAHSVPLIMLCLLQQRRPSRCPGGTERR